ncbi:MAG: KpsF/GutQ family sugar-phosphate isomerase [Phycisphaerae bacterium]|nr:KpsF/GutQ family sugar-phosphate isomerase [Phycisphaerae bacterium]
MTTRNNPVAAPDLDLARQVLAAEADAVRSLVGRVDGGFSRAAELFVACGSAGGAGTVVTTGIGKAGLVAQKISATLASTGTCSTFLHPVEAVHGDLGRLRKGDVLLALSQSGETEEIVRLVNVVRKLSVPLVSITASADSTLGRHSEVVLAIGQLAEACPLGLAPTASTTAMLALGDALALVVIQMRNFTPAQFAEFHPGGQIGRQLMRVEEAMGFRKGVNLPLFDRKVTVRQTLGQPAPAKVQKNLRSLRRPGAVLLTDAAGRLSGIFTDSDLRRLLNEGDESVLDQPVERFMIPNPKRIAAGQLVSAAMAIINQYRIDELPVVDANDQPVGLIDVQDIVALKLL